MSAWPCFREMGTASPPNDSLPQAALTRCLRELSDYVILRNEEDLFRNLRRGGDIDLLVHDQDLAERTLIRHLGVPIRVMRASDARGYSWDWGHVDLVQTIEWRGACYLRTEAILDRRRLSERGRPVPTIAHEAVISWLTSLLWGGFFKDRYAPEIRKAVEIDGSAFRQTLMEVAGKKWGGRLWQVAVDGCPEISAEWTRPLRQAVWWRAFWKSPPRTIQRFFAFVIAQLRLRFQPPVPWIAILGSDDDGKTSLAKEILHRFAACPYGTVKTFHWRRRVITRAHGPEPVTDPHGRPCGRRIGSGLRLLVPAADWLVGYWTRLVHLRAKGYILAFDRIYFDLVVDHERCGYGAGRLARALWWLLPKPDLLFLLDSEPAELWHRKQEVPPSELSRQRQAYRALVPQLRGGNVLDGSLPLSVLVDEVQCAIRAWMADRSVATESRVQDSKMTISRDDGKVTGTL
jgi:hypothetical protein